MSETDTIDLRAGGVRLRARWFAPRRSEAHPVIVLLHQGLGSITQWRGFPDLLAATTGCSVVAYDRLGHGGSEPITAPRPPDFLEREAFEILPEVLAALGVEHPILYGHSDGGSIALLFAAAFPQIPRAVIAEAAHVFSEVGATDGISLLSHDYRSGALRAKLARHHGGNVDAMFNSWFDVWTSAEMADWSMVGRLDRIVCPLLLVQGLEDEHGTLRQIDAISDHVAGRVIRYLVPGCGHMPHLEKSREVADRVRDFLAGSDP